MSKTTETTLRIRAQNLAKKELREVSKALDEINESQKNSATSAGLAARALRDLTTEQKNLQTVANELKRRGGILGNVEKQKAEIAATAAKIADLRDKLVQLTAKRDSGTAVKGLARDIRNVETAITAATNKLAKQQTAFDAIAKDARDFGVAAENAQSHLADINAELGRIDDLMAKNVAAQERYAGAVREAREARIQERDAARAVAAEAARRNAEEQAALQRRLDRLREIRAENDRIAAKRADSIAAFSAAPRMGVDTGLVHGPATRVDAVAMARQEAIAQRFNATLARINSTQQSVSAGQSRWAGVIQRTTAAIQAQNASMDRHATLSGIFADTGRKSLSFYQRLRGQILSTAAAYVGLYQAVTLVQQAVQVAQQRKAIEIKIKMANDGDVARTQKDLQFLRSEADRLGLVFEDLAKNYANFKIGARAAGLTQLEVNKYFSQAAEIITAMALSQEDADGVMRAFVQIMGKNKVQAEELRGQLGDRLPGAVAEFGKSLIALGKIKTLAETDKYIADGKAGMQEFLAFVDSYNKRVSGAVVENSKSIYAQFNRLKNAWRDFLIAFGETGVLNEVANVTQGLIEKLKSKEGREFAEQLGKGFTLLGKVIVWVIDNFELFVNILKAILALQAAKAIVGLTAGVVTLGARLLGTVGNLLRFAGALRFGIAGMTGFAGLLRGLPVLFGPVGLGLATLGGIFYGFNKAVAESEQRMDSWLDKLRVVRTAQGADLASGIDALKSEVQSLDKQIADTSARLQRRKAQGGGFFEQTDRLADRLKEIDGDVKSAEALQRKLDFLVQKRDATRQQISNGMRRQMREMKADAEMAAKDAAEVPTYSTGGGTGDADKAAKDAEKAAKAADNAADARRDAALRLQKELLDIENQIADARMAIGDKSNDDIQADVERRIAVIKNEMEVARGELAKMFSEASEKGDPAATGDAMKAAMARLELLERERIARVTMEADIERIEQAEKRVNDLIALREQLIETVNAEMAAGIKSGAEGRAEILRIQQELNPLIVQGANDLIALVKSKPDVMSELGAGNLVASMRAAVATAQQLDTVTQKIAKNLGGQFAAGVANAFGTLAKGLAGAIQGVNSIGDAFENAGKAFLEFLADFLVGIAQAIMQAIILRAIMNAIKGTTGGYWDAAMDALTGHTGGVVRSTSIGGTNPKREVSPLLFVNAPRFHDGGLPGLKPGEVPAILKTGEEVLDEDDPRNVLNGGRMGQPNVDLSIVNTIDAESVVAAGLNTRAGRRTIYNIIQADRSAIKRLLA